MYNIDPSKIKQDGFIPNKERGDLSDADKVLTYLKAWDRSHGFEYLVSVGHLRSLYVGAFLHKELGITELPKLEGQFNIIYQNFKKFKDWLNQHHKEGTLKQQI